MKACSVPTIVGSARANTRSLMFMFMFTLWTSFSCTHRIYGVTHTHTYIHSLATYRRHTGDHESKTNKSRPLYISPLSWSTLLLKSLNLPVTLLETTRKLTSFQNIPLPDVQFLRFLRCSIDGHIFNFDPQDPKTRNE